MAASDNEAEVEGPVFNEIEARIATRKKEQLDTRREFFSPGGLNMPIEFESNEVVLTTCWPFPPPQIVFPSCQKDFHRRDLLAVLEFRDPAFLEWTKRSYSSTTVQFSPAPCCRSQERFIEETA